MDLRFDMGSKQNDLNGLMKQSVEGRRSLLLKHQEETEEMNSKVKEFEDAKIGLLA